MNKAEQILDELVSFCKIEGYPQKMGLTNIQFKLKIIKQINDPIRYIINYIPSPFSVLKLQHYLNKNIKDIKFVLSSCDSLNDIINNHTKDRL